MRQGRDWEGQKLERSQRRKRRHRAENKTPRNTKEPQIQQNMKKIVKSTLNAFKTTINRFWDSLTVYVTLFCQANVPARWFSIRCHVCVCVNKFYLIKLPALPKSYLNWRDKSTHTAFWIAMILPSKKFPIVSPLCIYFYQFTIRLIRSM